MSVEPWAQALTYYNWFAMNEAEVPGYGYWVVPWGTTQAGSWDSRLARYWAVIICKKAVPWALWGPQVEKNMNYP